MPPAACSACVKHRPPLENMTSSPLWQTLTVVVVIHQAGLLWAYFFVFWLQHGWPFLYFISFNTCPSFIHLLILVFGHFMPWGCVCSEISRFPLHTFPEGAQAADDLGSRLQGLRHDHWKCGTVLLPLYNSLFRAPNQGWHAGIRRPVPFLISAHTQLGAQPGPDFSGGYSSLDHLVAVSLKVHSMPPHNTTSRLSSAFSLS